MWTRFLLMGAVTILGVEPPSGDDLSRWGRAGQGVVVAATDGVQGWVDGLTADWGQAAGGPESGMCGPGADLVDRAIVEAQTSIIEQDRAFAGIVDDMAARFARDLKPAPTEALSAVEPIADVPVFDAELACGDEAARAPASMLAASGASRVERLTSAVELTGRALRAWSSLLGPGASIAAVD